MAYTSGVVKRLSPQPAPVRPRVISPQTGETLLAEDWIEPFLRRFDAGALCLSGPPGSGKTTALAHLAARFPRPAVVVFLDEPDASEVEELRDHVTVVYTAPEPHRLGHLATAALAAWGEDERLEYLMAAHRARCGSVMSRVRVALEREDAPENAELWRVCLDEMAAHESMASVSQALRRRLDARFGWRQRRHARRVCLASMTGEQSLLHMVSSLLAFPGCLGGWLSKSLDPDQKRLLRYRRVQILLAAEQLARDLRSSRPVPCLESRLPLDLVREAGKSLAADAEAPFRLEFRVSSGPASTHPMLASLLHASGHGWTPERTRTLFLKGGYFGGARWAAFRLKNLNLDGADLGGAWIVEASVKGLSVNGAWLRGARLVGTSASGMQARGADFAGAELSHLRAPGAVFREADLSGATLELAFLRFADLSSANLSGARLCRADLTEANFLQARLDEADFSGANLESAILAHQDLRRAAWGGARFLRCNLRRSNLERMEIPGGMFESAILADALLTGSSMPGAKFYGADLSNAKLGDVEWEKADLREADLRGAIFHMGSSRSGLVFAAPLEGSRTGFYTDDYTDQHYRNPEEIRKANLRGADLRGAKIEGMDFYLVDLRDAKYTPEQEAHFRRCGAILSVRV